MFRNRHKLFFVLMVFLALPVCATLIHPGYLATVGPAPLRFSNPPIVSTNTFVPPPPAPPVTEVAPAPKPGAQTATTMSASSSQDSTGGTNQVPGQFPDGGPQEPVVSPQMLLRYFNKGTNGSGASITAPIDFTPPRPVEPSKATYSTGP